MGGIGSGNWFRSGKKRTVEESLAVAISDFRRRLENNASGTVVWKRPDGSKSSIGYLITLQPTPALNLHYRWRNSEDIKIPVRLQSTPTPFGGKRWWFTCPLAVSGAACNRRIGKLYLPPGARYFGCRKCHDLTYRSCKEAHQMDRLFARLGMVYDAEIGQRCLVTPTPNQPYC